MTDTPFLWKFSEFEYIFTQNSWIIPLDARISFWNLENYWIWIFGNDCLRLRQRRKIPLNSVTDSVCLSQCLFRWRKLFLHLHVDIGFNFLVSDYLWSASLGWKLQFCASPLFILLSNCIKYSHILDSYGLSDFKLMSTYIIEVSNVCIYPDLTWPHYSKNSF